MKTYIIVKKEDAFGGEYYSEDLERFTDDVEECSGYYDYELASEVAEDVNGYVREATDRELKAMEG